MTGQGNTVGVKLKQRQHEYRLDKEGAPSEDKQLGAHVVVTTTRIPTLCPEGAQLISKLEGRLETGLDYSARTKVVDLEAPEYKL